VTRSGIEIAGIDRPAQWCARRLLPLLSAWPVRGLLVAVVAAGVWSLLAGRPDGPQVTAHPALDGLLGLGIGLLCSAAHEFAHAVALAHYGRRSRRAGFGFYWGAISSVVAHLDR
jgi:putative peptide zinc metalloprotease protein